MRKAVIVFLLSFASFAGAADKPCSKAEAATAEKAIDRVVNWQQLHKAWQDYRHCDGEKSVADMYTDAIVRLAVGWNNVSELAAGMKDPQYHDFVYAHLKSDAAKDDRESVYARAKKDCPRGQDAFCDEMAGIMRTALDADDEKAIAAEKAGKKK